MSEYSRGVEDPTWQKQKWKKRWIPRRLVENFHLTEGKYRHCFYIIWILIVTFLIAWGFSILGHNTEKIEDIVTEQSRAAAVNEAQSCAARWERYEDNQRLVKDTANIIVETLSPDDEIVQSNLDSALKPILNSYPVPSCDRDGALEELQSLGIEDYHYVR